MLLPPMLDDPEPSNGVDAVLGAPPFTLPELDLGRIGKRTGKTVTALEDDEDPREEAQMIQLLKQMQKVKQSKENKRKRGEIAARTKVVAGEVRRNASKRVEEAKCDRNKLITDIRSTMESLRAAIQEEANLAAVLHEEQQAAMKAAVDALNEKYDQAAEVHTKLRRLGDCMREHFQVVRTHVAAQVESEISDTEEVVQGIHRQSDSMLSLITGAGGFI